MFLVFAAFLILTALGGGSAFPDTLSLLYVRPVAVLALAAFLLIPASPTATSNRRTLRVPLVLLGLLALLIAGQLVPLPPGLWTALPGRAPYLAAATLAGTTQPWRPLSLTPDLTANSLAALIVPAAALAGFARLSPVQRDRLIPGFIILCMASMALGVAQFAGGEHSALYLYRRAHVGTTAGLLANRNHQAAMLAALFPALRAWTLMPGADRRWAERRRWLALALGVAAVPVILATGSRAGTVLSLAGLAAALALFPPDARAFGRNGGRRARIVRAAALAIPAALAFVTWYDGRALSIARLTGTAPDGMPLEDDLRIQFAPLVVRLVRTFLPVGSGFGSFDPVFRQYEPDAVLADSYFNHAHNELLEIAMTAGLAGLGLLAAFIVWWALMLWRALRIRPRPHEARMTLLGATVVGILLVASLVDYPLRTPLLGAWFAIACGWMCTRRLDSAGRAAASTLP